MTIGQQLKAAIQAHGTAYRIAKESGVAVAIVQRFLNGERDLRMETAGKLCETLGLELRPVRKAKGK